MRSTKLTASTILLFSLYLASGCQSPDDMNSEPDYSSRLDSVSYSLGYFYGSSMANEGIDEFNYRNFAAGLRNAMEEQDSDLDEMEMQSAIQNFQMDLQQIQQDRAESNREEAEHFLTVNAQRDDVTVTESGLQYRVIEEGDGQQPDPESNVRVHYRGTLIDGEEFDSSYSRNEPAEFPLNRVIPGWTEGLQLMEEGATYEFYIPSELGYGNNPPQGSPITPGDVLIFEVELIDVLD